MSNWELHAPTGDIDWEQSKYLTSCTQRRQGTILRRLLVSGGHVRLVRGALTVLRHRRGAWKDGDEDNWETGGLPGHDGGICPEDSAWGGHGADGGPLSVSPRSTLLRIGCRGLEEEPQAAEQRGAGDAGWALWRVGRRPWSVIQIVASCEAFPFCADCAWRRKFRPRGRVSSVNVIC